MEQASTDSTTSARRLSLRDIDGLRAEEQPGALDQQSVKKTVPGTTAHPAAEVEKVLSTASQKCFVCGKRCAKWRQVIARLNRQTVDLVSSHQRTNSKLEQNRECKKRRPSAVMPARRPPPLARQCPHSGSRLRTAPDATRIQAVVSGNEDQQDLLPTMRPGIVAMA